MNPELERLLAALEARDNALPDNFPAAAAEVERLLAPILESLSPIGRADFLRALQSRYRAYLKGKEHPPTLPQQTFRTPSGSRQWITLTSKIKITLRTAQILAPFSLHMEV